MPALGKNFGRDVCATCLAMLPKRLLTTVAGRFLRSPVSRLLVRRFAQFYKISLEECERPWRDYRSLAEFFARRLQPNLRALPTDCIAICSPVDGVVAQIGTIEAGSAIQAKGHGYALDALLTERADAFEGGQYLTIYLSPSDYHRIHSPLAGKLLRVVHVPGTLFPVNRLGSQSVRNLFTRNERVISWLEGQGRHMVIISVGSLIVGSVQLASAFSSVVRKNRSRGEAMALMEASVAIDRGDELGWFEFGSTVIMLFRPGEARIAVAQGQRVFARAAIGQWIS